MKSSAPPSYAGNCPPPLIPNGAIEGSNGKDSQSSAAISFSDGMKPTFDILCGIGVSVKGSLSDDVGGGGSAEDLVVVPWLFFTLFDNTSKLRRRRDTCISNSAAYRVLRCMSSRAFDSSAWIVFSRTSRDSRSFAWRAPRLSAFIRKIEELMIRKKTRTGENRNAPVSAI